MAERWNTNTMPVIEGEVTSLGTATSEYGEFQVIELKNLEDGETYSVAAFHAVLRRMVEEAGLEPGDNIRVEYLGKETSKKGREFHNYRLERL